MKAFLTNEYGLIPYDNQWMVISGKEQLTICWSYESGVEYINKLEGKKEVKYRKKVNKQILGSLSFVDTLTTDHKRKSTNK